MPKEKKTKDEILSPHLGKSYEWSSDAEVTSKGYALQCMQEFSDQEKQSDRQEMVEIKELVKTIKAEPKHHTVIIALLTAELFKQIQSIQ